MRELAGEVEVGRQGTVVHSMEGPEAHRIDQGVPAGWAVLGCAAPGGFAEQQLDLALRQSWEQVLLDDRPAQANKARTIKSTIATDVTSEAMSGTLILE